MDDVARMLQEHIDAGTLPGAVALHLRDGRTEAVVLGVQDLGTGAPMSRRTLFHWDSLGKPLTAALALTFVADGSLALESPIARWLPELSEPRVLADASGPLTDTVPADRPVTVRDLLTLRGGLGVTTDFESPFTAALFSRLQEGPAPRTLSREDFLRAAAELPLAHQPGEGWTYNTGSTLLGLLLERVTERPLDELMARRLLEPLDMTDTMWSVPAPELPRFASRYAPSGDPQQPLTLVDPADGQYARPPSFPDGAGGLIGTAEDWMAFAAILLDAGTHRGREVLPAPLVTAMMTDHLTAAQRRRAGIFLEGGEGWGYGGSVRKDGTYGWSGGAGTTTRVDPRQSSAQLLFTQVALDGPEGSPVLAAFEDCLSSDGS